MAEQWRLFAYEPGSPGSRDGPRASASTHPPHTHLPSRSLILSSSVESGVDRMLSPSSDECVATPHPAWDSPPLLGNNSHTLCRSRCHARRACHPSLGAGGVAPRPDTWTARSACVCPRENVRCALRGLPAHAPEPELDPPLPCPRLTPVPRKLLHQVGLLVGVHGAQYGARRRHGASALAQIIRHPRSWHDCSWAMHP